MVSNAADADPSQGCMYQMLPTSSRNKVIYMLLFWVVFFQKPPSPPRHNGISIFTNAAKHRPAPRVLVSNAPNAVPPQGFNFFLKCRQRRPALRVLVKNAPNAVLPQGYVDLNCRQRRPALSVLLTNAANAVPSQGYV